MSSPYAALGLYGPSRRRHEQCCRHQHPCSSNEDESLHIPYLGHQIHTIGNVELWAQEFEDYVPGYIDSLLYAKKQTKINADLFALASAMRVCDGIENSKP